VKLILDDALLPGLDGEWVDGTDAYPSGDGTAGGDFNFRINIRRGDANQDGSVNALDLGQVKAKLNSSATNPGSGATGYSVFADLNAGGSINALDLGIAKANRDRPSPPAIEPGATSPSGLVIDGPSVTQVFVNGPGLTGQTSANGVAFRNLAAIDNTFGYPVPAGANQLKYIPWSRGIDRIAIRFNYDVGNLLEQDDLVVRGVNTVNHDISGFSYDRATQTGVWTLSTPILNDKLRLILDDAQVPGLDGDWTNGADAYPSGDGDVGGDFDFRLNVLRGDANQDGRVNSLDLGQVKAKLNSSATNPGAGASGYSVFADVNADGLINALDLGFVKAHPYRPIEPGLTSLLFGTKAISR
jgi:hypothetical protein